MDTLVERTVGIFEREPVDIYANPTYLPDVIAKDYDALWTEGRIERVVSAAAKNKVAIELNDRYKIPSANVVRMAKAAGCKFTFGTNNSGPNDLGRSQYGIGMVQKLKLTWQDFFVPEAWWPKAIERKGSALRG
jgi:histidinol phosphatase-like PHP family hydrolase